MALFERHTTNYLVLTIDDENLEDVWSQVKNIKGVEDTALTDFWEEYHDPENCWECEEEE
tara:strand:+ start:384 stop:563 length:180 start_codon:yes stop_codon:yes gene_type:complete